MAWISVDQKLIGGKLRTLHKAIGCSRNEALGILVTLWLWAIDNTDADGMLISTTLEDIQEDVLKPGLSPDLDPGTVAKALVENQWIDEREGHLYVHDWKSWRYYYDRITREDKSRVERNRRYRDRKPLRDVSEDVSKDVSKDVSRDASVEKSPKPEAKKPTQADKYGVDFEEFWQIYPRHDRKPEAFKCFGARLKDGYTKDQIMLAARTYRTKCDRDHQDPRYILMARTFLGSNLTFTDYLPKQTTQATQQQPSMNPDGNPFRKTW